MSTRTAPKDVTGYTYEFKNADVWDGDSFTEFKGEALKQGLSNDQLQWLMTKHEDVITGVMDQFDNPAKTEESLRGEWGNKYEDQMKSARKAWDTYADDTMDIDAVGNNPQILKLLAKLGKELHEDTPMKSGQSGSSVDQSELMDKMRAKMADGTYYEDKAFQALIKKTYGW